MSFGINGADPFKSYASSSEAGGGMGVFAKRKKQKKEDKKEGNSILNEDIDEDNLEIDMDDDFML